MEKVNFNARFSLQEFINQAHYARELVRKNILESQAEMKRYFDKTAKNIKYELNDLVLLHNTRTTHGSPKKLSQSYLGPFFIHRVLPNNAYRLVHYQTGQELRFPVNGRRLKLAHLPSESRVRSNIPNRIDPSVAQNVMDRRQNNEHYVPPGGEEIEFHDEDKDTSQNHGGNESQENEENNIQNSEDESHSEEQEDNELIGTSQNDKSLPDVSVTKIINVLKNRQGRWYFCRFSDGKDMYLHHDERNRIPQSMRDEYHNNFTWKNKKKKKKKLNVGDDS